MNTSYLLKRRLLLKITTKDIAGVEYALKAMRLPMKSKGDSSSAVTFTLGGTEEVLLLGEKDAKLAKTLSGAKPGSGHDSFIKGISVIAELKANHAFWLQWMRYSFADIISSESKMHSIVKGSIGDSCDKWVSSSTINLVDDLIYAYNNYVDAGEDHEYLFEGFMLNNLPTTKKELFECIISNTPIGYELTAGVTLNYLTLKTMYKQRKSHKLSYWNTEFVEWVETLPYSWLITGKKDV